MLRSSRKGLLGLLTAACGGAVGPSDRVIDAGTPSPGGTESPVQLAADPNMTPFGIAIDDTDVYWTDWGTSPDFTDGAVKKVAKSGGAVRVLAEGLSRPFGIVVDATRAYFTMQGGTVKAVPIDGGPSVDVARNGGEPLLVATDGTAVYWTDGIFSAVMRGQIDANGPQNTLLADVSLPYGIATNGTEAFVASRQDGSLWKVFAHSPATPTRLADAPAGFQGYEVALGASAVFWRASSETFDDGRILSAPLVGGATTTLIQRVHGMNNGLAVDTTDAYFTAGGDVSRVPVAGGASTVMTSGQSANGIAVDDAAIYWTNGTGSVMKLAKPR
jgi:hypothetical protein